MPKTRYWIELRLGMEITKIFQKSGKNTGLGKKFILMQGDMFLKLWKMSSEKVFVEYVR